MVKALRAAGLEVILDVVQYTARAATTMPS